MRHLRFLPLAFLAGVHGFILFAPYAAVVLAAAPLLACARRRGQAVTVVDGVPAGIA